MGKHEKILAAIFSDPVRSSLRWADIEALFEHFGAEITEGSGSRVRVFLNGVRATFRRPHPTPNTDKGAVKSVREFLQNAGIDPNDIKADR
jgi:hypothetical protein